MGKQWETLFSWAPKSLQVVTAAMKLKDAYFLEEKLWQTRQHIKKQRLHFTDKCPYSQSYVFFSSHVWTWELDHKEGWAPKNCWFQTVELEKTLESLLDCKEIKLVNPKGNQPWIVIGRTDAEAKAPILSPPDAKSWLIRKDPDAGKDWGQEEKGATENEMGGWHHWLNGHESEQTQGDSEGQGSLACSGHGVAMSWTRLSNWTELNWSHVHCSFIHTSLDTETI